MYCQVYLGSNTPMKELIGLASYDLQQDGIILSPKSTQVAKSDIYLFCHGLYTNADLEAWNIKAQKFVLQQKKDLKFLLVYRRIQDGTSAADSTAQPRSGVYADVQKVNKG